MRFPFLTSLLQHFLRNPELDDVLHCVNMYNVSILDEGDWPTDLGLGCDVTDAEPVRPVGCWRRAKKGAILVSDVFTNWKQRSIQAIQYAAEEIVRLNMKVMPLDIIGTRIRKFLDHTRYLHGNPPSRPGGSFSLFFHGHRRGTRSFEKGREKAEEGGKRRYRGRGRNRGD